MKLSSLLALAPLLLIAGCNSAPETDVASVPALEPAPASEPVNWTAEEELQKTCRVCVVDDGERVEEYVPSRLDKEVDGRTYRFCKDICREKFDARSERYLLSGS